MTTVSRRSRLLPFLSCLILLLGATAARAQDPLEPGGGLVWGSLGFQGDLGGAVTSSGIGVVDGLPAEINTNTWAERYDAALIFRIGGAYNVSSRGQVFGAVSWEQSEADVADVGLFNGQPMAAKFSDYQGWGIDVGYRHFFVTDYVAKPFVSGSLGFQRIQNITVDLSSGAPGSGVGFTALDIPLYDDSWVTTWRLGGGILWDLNDHFGIQATADVKYSGILSDQAGIGTAGFERVNDVGNRLTLPIMGGVYVKF